MIGCDRMNFSSLIFGFAVLGGTAPSAFAQTKRLSPVVRERRGLKDTKFGNTAQFIKEENTLPLKGDKSGFLKSDAGYGPHGSHMSGPHYPEMSYDFDYDYPPGGGGDEPHGYGPHGSHMSGPHYPEMSYDYDYDYGHHYYGPDGYEPHGHGSPHGVEPMSHEEARYVFCTSLTFYFTCNPTFSLPHLQHRAIMHIAKHCPTEVMAMNECYPNQEVLMMCTNCIWEGLLGSGMNCTELEVDYESCISYCLPECDEEVSAVYECGLGSGMCEGGGLDDYLDDYLMSYGPDGYGIDDIIPPMSNEEASYVL